MKILAANDLVRNALRRSAYPTRATPNGPPHRFWSLSNSEDSDRYRGPFQAVLRLGISNQRSVQLKDGMRNTTSSPGCILLASGQLWGKAVQCSLNLPDTSAKHYTILYGVIDFWKGPTDNGWMTYFFSDADDVSEYSQDRYCRFPIASFQNDSVRTRLIQQLQFGDFRVVTHLGKWYEDEE